VYIRLIESYKVPYLEALHHLPSTVIRHLTKHNVQALSPAVSARVCSVGDTDQSRANGTACTNCSVFTWANGAAGAEIVGIVQNSYARVECFAYVMACSAGPGREP
jgi:hypothetical protein